MHMQPGGVTPHQKTQTDCNSSNGFRSFLQMEIKKEQIWKAILFQTTSTSYKPEQDLQRHVIMIKASTWQYESTLVNTDMAHIGAIRHWKQFLRDLRETLPVPKGTMTYNWHEEIHHPDRKSTMKQRTARPLIESFRAGHHKPEDHAFLARDTRHFPE